MGHILRGKFCGAATVGERGQIVVPAEARKIYGLDIGDKVLVFHNPHLNGLVLIKAEQVTKILSETIDQLGKIVEETAKTPEDPEQA